MIDPTNNKPQKSLQVLRPTYRVEECLAEIRICLEAGWTGMGFKTIEFEEAWSTYTSLPYSHFLSSATAGLEIALHILKSQNEWDDGDEVITTPLTFISSNHAILHQGLTPVFADVDEHLCLDVESIRSRITPKTRAVLFVGLGGNTGQLEAVSSLCKKAGLKLVLDAAHMAGTRIHGQHVGKEADISVFSFQAVKNLPTADAGMICCSDEASDALARKLSWLGINKDTYARTIRQGSYKWYYDVEHTGYKYHGNSVMAALGLVGLRYLDQDNAYRRQLCRWYDEQLSGIQEITRIPIAAGCESSSHLYQILVEGRDEIMMALADVGVHPGVHYRSNIEYSMFHDVSGANSCPLSKQASETTVSLPMHLGISRIDVEFIADSLKTILSHRSSQRMKTCA